MKFKVGDKVVLGQPSFDLVDAMYHEFGKEDTIVSSEYTPHGLFYRMNLSQWRWHESGVTSAEPQEYFYVGQTVYSPFFNNKENKAVVTKIDKTMDYPVLCEGDNSFGFFTLDGKFHINQDFISLFQEPIQFPVNKSIERFEEGEVVEVSSNGEYWRLARFVSYNDHDILRYKVTITTGINREIKEIFNYSSIRKIK